MRLTVKYQFVSEHTLEKASAISEEDEHQDLSLLPQAMHPRTDFHPLPSVGCSFVDLDLKERERERSEGDGEKEGGQGDGERKEEDRETERERRQEERVSAKAVY